MAAASCKICSRKLSFFENGVVIDGITYCPACHNSVVADKDGMKRKLEGMIVSTTPQLDGFRVEKYLGTVCSLSFFKLDVVQDWFADLGDIWGGKSPRYTAQFASLQADVEAKLKFQAAAIGANAVIGVHFDFEFVETNISQSWLSLSQNNRKLMASAAGTAVIVAAT